MRRQWPSATSAIMLCVIGVIWISYSWASVVKETELRRELYLLAGCMQNILDAPEVARLDTDTRAHIINNIPSTEQGGKLVLAGMRNGETFMEMVDRQGEQLHIPMWLGFVALTVGFGFLAFAASAHKNPSLEKETFGRDAG